MEDVGEVVKKDGVEEDSEGGGEQASEMSLHVSNAGWTPIGYSRHYTRHVGFFSCKWSGGCAWSAIC
jgi:hypothetical protein